VAPISIPQDINVYNKLIKDAEESSNQFFDPLFSGEYEKTILPKIRELEGIFASPAS